MAHRSLRVAALLVIIALTGCGGPYRITEPVSGKVYYAKSIDRRDYGGIEFIDAVTGHDVLLQNAEIETIDPASLPEAAPPAP